MIAIVQSIEVRYGKPSRGAVGARMRSALPATLPIPTSETDLLHQITLDEWDGFAARASAVPLVVPPHGLLLGTRIRVSVDGDGITLADTYGHTSISVTRGWGRLRCNDRVETHDAWWYRDLIVNAARVRAPGSGNVFAGDASVSTDLRTNIERRRVARLR